MRRSRETTCWRTELMLLLNSYLAALANAPIEANVRVYRAVSRDLSVRLLRLLRVTITNRQADLIVNAVA